MYSLSENGKVVLRADGINCVTAAVQAVGTLSFSKPVVNGDTVTIDSDVFEFTTDGTVESGNIAVPLVDLNIEPARQQLVRVINANSTVVTAKAPAGTNTIVVTAVEGGTAGNSLATTETSTSLAWGAATLEDGAAAPDSVAFPLFTLETIGKKFVPTAVLFYLDDLDTLTTEPTISLGTNDDDFNDLLPDTDLAGLDTEEGYLLADPADLLLVDPGATVYAKVNTIADATIYNISVVVEGYYI